MTPAKILPILEAWAAETRLLEQQLGLLRTLTGATYDSGILASIYRLWEAYTAAVAANVGDEAEWLQWYALECDMSQAG